MFKYGPYAAKNKSKLGPFEQTSQAEDVRNPNDLGPDRSSTPGRVDPARLQDYSAQQRPPKPFPGKFSQKAGYNPYSNAGGLAPFLGNANEPIGPQALAAMDYDPYYTSEG